MNRTLSIALLVAAVVVAGCGGSGPVPTGPPGDGVAGLVEVGPMVIRPASTAGFSAEALDVGGRCAMVVLSGARIDYMASQAMLDRIVYTSDADGYFDIWARDLDGSNAVQITNNGATEAHPEWSHDGSRIVFQRQWPASDSEVMTMNADGSTIRAVTDNTAVDEMPCWSPDSRKIAFQTNRTGNYEIFWTFADGSWPGNLTNHAASDREPDWSSDLRDPSIAFISDRDGDREVFTMGADGGNIQQITSNTVSDHFPAWDPHTYQISFDRDVGGAREVFLRIPSTAGEAGFSNHPALDGLSAWSTDGRWIVFTSQRLGHLNLWLQETDEPYRAYQVTSGNTTDAYAHLGSPTMQTERVLIGPAGSDWGGLDPVWDSAYAGIVAYSNGGYEGFVRIGVRTGDLDELEVTPLLLTAQSPPRAVGVLVEAPEIVNLREDAGRGADPVVWDLDALNPTAALLYFDDMRGTLLSVLVVRDVAYPAGADAPAVQQTVQGQAVVASGNFCAVFDAHGRNIAPGGATRVSVDVSGGPCVLD